LRGDSLADPAAVLGVRRTSAAEWVLVDLAREYVAPLPDLHPSERARRLAAKHTITMLPPERG
jgi:hypothetical protein